MERPDPTEQGRNAARASAPEYAGLRFRRPTLIVGFDTEYRRHEPEADDLKVPAADGAAVANEILCYSFAVLEPATGYLHGSVIHLEDGKGSRRHRLSLARLLAHALKEAWRADDLPEVIMLAGHYSRADLCGFRDFPSLKRMVDAVRKTFTSSTQPLKLDYPRQDGSEGTFTIYLIDTYLLAPAGKRRLADLGALVGRPKLESPARRHRRHGRLPARRARGLRSLCHPRRRDRGALHGPVPRLLHRRARPAGGQTTPDPRRRCGGRPSERWRRTQACRCTRRSAAGRPQPATVASREMVLCPTRVCGLWAYIVPCYSLKQRHKSRSMWACRCRCGRTIADS